MKTHEIHNEGLKKYLNGEISGAELADFENQIASDDFLRDAVEGYKKTAANPSDLEVLKKKLFRKKKKVGLLKALLYSGIAAAISAIAIFYISQIQNTNTDSGNQASQSIHRLQIINDSILTSDTINNNIQLFTPKNNTLTSELRPLPKKVIVPESIAPLNLNKNIKIIPDYNNLNISDYYKYQSNHLYTYIGNYKVVDYRFDKRIKSGLSDIPSHFQSFEFKNGLPVSSNEISYIEFLELALNKTKSGKYNDAIDDFDIILDQYPSDVNAVFYKAFCLYKLNNNYTAIKYFDIALSGRINTFKEESMWYKGLIYKEEKQYAAAEKVLKEIIYDNGYYGAQAKKELDELYQIYINE